MSDTKTPIYPEMDNMWAASSTGYSMAIVAHNMGVVAASMLEQQKINLRNTELLKQIDDQMKAIRKTLEDLNKRRIVVQK